MAIESYHLTINLLGDFTVRVNCQGIDDSLWRLRKVKSLLKLLALAPRRRLHREQVMDLLWPELDPEAAANNLYKTIFIARRGLESRMPRDSARSYLRLQGDLLILGNDRDVSVDTVAFRAAADEARASRNPEAYEVALAIYTGDLLPEDRYEDWVLAPQEALKALRFTLLFELAEVKEQRGEIEGAIEVLRQAVASDAANEQANGSLMRLLAQTGQRHLALRQYQQLRTALDNEMGVEPCASIQSLYQQVLTNRILPKTETPELIFAKVQPPVEYPSGSALVVGREAELSTLLRWLDRASYRERKLALVHGPAGVGKTKMLRELVRRAGARGTVSLWGGQVSPGTLAPCGAFAAAVADLAVRTDPVSLRAVLGDAAPYIARLVPSLAASTPTESLLTDSRGPDRWLLFSSIAEFLKRLAAKAPVLIVIDDLQAADDLSLQLLPYLASVLRNSPIQIISAFRSDGALQHAPLRRMLSEVHAERLADELELPTLGFEDTEVLIRSLLPGHVDEELRNVLHRTAGGNPYFIEQAVSALTGRGMACNDEGCWRLRIGVSDTPTLSALRRPLRY